MPAAVNVALRYHMYVIFVWLYFLTLAYERYNVCDECEDHEKFERFDARGDDSQDNLPMFWNGLDSMRMVLRIMFLAQVPTQVIRKDDDGMSTGTQD